MLRADTNTSSGSPNHHEPQEMTNSESDNQSQTYSKGWLLDDEYQTIHSRPKVDVVLLKMNSGDAWFAEDSVNGTKFKFLKDAGASKSVMSMKCFKSIPELF